MRLTRRAFIAVATTAAALVNRPPRTAEILPQQILPQQIPFTITGG